MSTFYLCPLRPFTPDIFIKMIKDFFVCFIYNAALEHKVVINKETKINDLFAIKLAGRKSLMRMHCFAHRLSTKGKFKFVSVGLWDIQIFES